MTIAIAKAYNGIHCDFNRQLKLFGVNAFYFNLDGHDWFKVASRRP